MRIAFKTVTLSDVNWMEVTAPISCSYYFIHVIGSLKPNYFISSNIADPTEQDTIESGWTSQIPSWGQPGVRWEMGESMFWLLASSGNSGMQVGITFVL
jgi:hypothetical protein